MKHFHYYIQQQNQRNSYTNIEGNWVEIILITAASLLVAWLLIRILDKFAQRNQKKTKN